MSRARALVALGIRRGLIDYRRSLRLTDFLFICVPPVAVLVFFWFQRDASLAEVSLATSLVPSMFAMQIVMAGYPAAVAAVLIDRDDGTLTRCKALPGGLVVYLVSKVVSILLSALMGIALFLPTLVFAHSLQVRPGPLVLAGLVGLVCAASWGILVGGFLKNGSNSMGAAVMPIFVLLGISGIFWPIVALPWWLQVVAQVFPVYWLGLAFRAFMLPDTAAALEIAGMWREPLMAGVLGAWTLVALVAAPAVLKRVGSQISSYPRSGAHRKNRTGDRALAGGGR